MRTCPSNSAHALAVVTVLAISGLAAPEIRAQAAPEEAGTDTSTASDTDPTAPDDEAASDSAEKEGPQA